MLDIESLVEILSDIFPTHPRSELKARVASCGSIDTVVEELIAKEQQPEIEVPVEQKLEQIFPGMPPAKVEKVLKQNDGNLAKAVEDLSEYDKTLDELTLITGLDKDTIEPYLKKHDCVLQALVDLVCVHRRKRRVRRSRVQDSRTAGLAKLVESYTYNGASPEAGELRNAVSDDAFLQTVNYAFLIKCLEFFEGEVDRVIRVAYLFVDSHLQQLTFRPDLQVEVHDVNPMGSAADVLRAKKKPEIKLKAQPKPKISFSTSVKSRSPNISPPPVPAALDLHGFTVADAIKKAENASFLWWELESQQRQAHGILTKFGSKAAFMDPLELVTGRGLHSSGGPKVRSSVIKRLTQLGYVLEEDTGRVLVLGKKLRQ